MIKASAEVDGCVQRNGKSVQIRVDFVVSGISWVEVSKQSKGWLRWASAIGSGDGYMRKVYSSKRKARRYLLEYRCIGV